MTTVLTEESKKKTSTAPQKDEQEALKYVRDVSPEVKNIFEKLLYPAVVAECKAEIRLRNQMTRESLKGETNETEAARLKSLLVPFNKIDEKAIAHANESIVLYQQNNHDRHFSKNIKKIIDGYMLKIMGKEEHAIDPSHAVHSNDVHNEGWDKAYKDLQAFSDMLKIAVVDSVAVWRRK